MTSILVDSETFPKGNNPTSEIGVKESTGDEHSQGKKSQADSRFHVYKLNSSFLGYNPIKTEGDWSNSGWVHE